jgi:hypothetical protein
MSNTSYEELTDENIAVCGDKDHTWVEVILNTGHKGLSGKILNSTENLFTSSLYKYLILEALGKANQNAKT